MPKRELTRISSPRALGELRNSALDYISNLNAGFAADALPMQQLVKSGCVTRACRRDDADTEGRAR
jgi:hypothetical protein